MLFCACVSCLVFGLALATSAARRPRHRAVLEGAGGLLIVCGLALIGSGLPIYR